MNALLVAELVSLFREELRLCKVKPGEVVLGFTSASFPYPEYGPALLAAARDLGAQSYLMISPTGTPISERLALEAWKCADLVVGMFTLTFPNMWLYSEAHNEVLASGTRTLMVIEPPASLRRMAPTDALVERTYAGARRVAAAREVRITDDFGTDLVLHKGDRKGVAVCGVSDRPGRWDHWPGGQVACAPLEDNVEGTYVMQPGDIIVRLKRYVSDPLRINWRHGRIVDIEGGADAVALRDYLESFHDPDAFGISHAGWGTNSGADWNALHSNIGMDAENFYGSVMVAVGRNSHHTPDDFSGLGGTNNSLAHVDMCCLNKSVYLDGELVMDHGSFVRAELR